MDDQEDGDLDNDATERSPSSSPLLTDIFGFGALAKSPASREIAKSIGKITGALTDPTRTLLMGLAKAKVESNRIRSIARAQADARQVEVSADQLIERMKERVVASEVRRQINIEVATAEAIELANDESDESAPRTIEDDWLTSWIEGASEVSASEVRTIWSKVLAAESRASSNHVSKASLPILRLLDAQLASALVEFVKFLVYYGAFPSSDKMLPNVAESKQIAMLKEIGFLTDSIGQKFSFKEFKLHLGGGTRVLGGMMHPAIVLTHRGFEICNAVFDDAQMEKEHPDEQTMLMHYHRIISGSLEEGPVPIGLEFSENSGAAVFVTLNRAGSSVASVGEEMINSSFAEARLSLSSLSRQILAGLSLAGNLVDIKVRKEG